MAYVFQEDAISFCLPRPEKHYVLILTKKIIRGQGREDAPCQSERICFVSGAGVNATSFLQYLP